MVYTVLGIKVKLYRYELRICLILKRWIHACNIIKFHSSEHCYLSSQMLKVKIKKFCNLAEHLLNPIYLYLYIIPLFFFYFNRICPDKF